MSGRGVGEEEQSVELTIETKCPRKWLFVDLETGDIWHQNETSEKRWRHATDLEGKELKKLVAVQEMERER